MKSTQLMRNRLRELSKPNLDDYDRAVIAVLDDLEIILGRSECPYNPCACQDAGMTDCFQTCDFIHGTTP